MNYDTYYIPANFTDAGRLFGIFEIRNVIEAVILGAPTLFLCFTLFPFPLTARIIVSMIIVVPLGGFALIGISGDSLSRYLRAWRRWRRRKKILTYKGSATK